MSISEALLEGDGAPIALETNPADPYSVHLNSFFINGAMYLDPALDRTWYQHMQADPNVRVKLSGDENLYTAIAVVETDEAVINQFEDDRIVIRLDPR